MDPDLDDGLEAPWSPNSIFLFTIFGGSLVGGVMAVLNVDRLRLPEEKRKTLTVFGYVAVAAVIIMLSDVEKDTVTSAIRLRPKFLGFMDGDLEKIVPVVEKLIRTNVARELLQSIHRNK